MRIDRLHVEGFLGIRSVDLPLNGTVTAVFGPNGSGKSSLKDAVSFCALGETARAPKMRKKDFQDLLHPGSKRGQTTLVIDGVTFSRGLPSGNCSTATPDPPKGWEYLLDPVAFLRLGLEERRKELFRVLGINMGVGAIQEKLVEHGYRDAIIDEIMPKLRERE